MSPPPKTLLELGSGCGRLTRPMVDAGYEVTAVDNSNDMLNEINYAETVLADIEPLSLDRRFDTILLASRVINCPDPKARERMIRTARKHLKEGGVFLLEVHPETILDTKTGDSSKSESYDAKIVSSDIFGTRASITIEYTIDDDIWLHSFETEYVEPHEVERLLEKNGFKISAFHS